MNPFKTKRLSRTLSRFSAQDSKLVLTLQNKKQQLPLIKNAQLQNPSMENNHINNSNIKTLERELIRDKTCLLKPNHRQIFKSLQPENSNQNSTNQNKSLQKARPSYSSTLFKRQKVIQQTNKLSLHKPQHSQNTDFRIIDLLRGNKNKENHTKKKRILSEDSKFLNNYQKKSPIQKSLLKRQDKSEKVQNTPFQRIIKPTGLQISKGSQAVPSLIHNQLLIEKKLKTNKLNKIKICSCTHSIIVHFSSKCLKLTSNMPGDTQKVDQQIQTYQSEPQVFQYLVYKRKKQQYEKELENAFKQLEIIKNDQKICEERVSKIEQNYQEPPKDQREERIFALKRQILLYQNKIMLEISKKHKDNRGMLERMKNVDQLLINGLKKIQNINKNYLQIFKEIFQKHNETKYIRIASRIQTISAQALKQIYSKIKQQMKSCYMEKENNKELGYYLEEFMKCVNEEKVLLRNCFQHIKYLPELFYKLFGDQVQENQQKDLLSVFNFALKQKDLLNCMKCYNTERKMRLIVQKNAQIQSVLKVADQLVK